MADLHAQKWTCRSCSLVRAFVEPGQEFNCVGFVATIISAPPTSNSWCHPVVGWGLCCQDPLAAAVFSVAAVIPSPAFLVHLWLEVLSLPARAPPPSSWLLWLILWCEFNDDVAGRVMLLLNVSSIINFTIHYTMKVFFTFVSQPPARSSRCSAFLIPIKWLLATRHRIGCIAPEVFLNSWVFNTCWLVV